MGLGDLNPSLIVPPALPTVGIPQSTAHVLSLCFATSYVGSIYLATHFSRLSSSKAHSRKTGLTENGGDAGVVPPQVEGGPQPGERDHPDTIKLRMKAVGSATLLNLLTVLEAVRRASSGDPSVAGVKNALRPTLRLCGFPTSLPSLIPSCTPQALLPYILAPTLLLGPLVAMYLDRALPFQGYGRFTYRWERMRKDWGLVEWRNYVVGPLTEELTFRACILAVSILASCSPRWLVFGTPLWFGVAHIHHAWELYKRSGLLQAVAVTLFQLTYTTLFGWFASYLFIRTGSIIPPLVAHVYCNMMGIYLPTTAVSRHPSRKWAIISSYILGIAGFVYGLRLL